MIDVVHDADEQPGTRGAPRVPSGTAAAKPAPAPSGSPRKSYTQCKTVFIGQEALGRIQAFAASNGPQIGIVKGRLVSQGVALVSEIVPIARYRDVGALCGWKVQVAEGGVCDTAGAIGAIILESGAVEYEFVLPSLRPLLVGVEAPLVLKIQRFRNPEGQLVLKTVCSLYSSNLSSRLKGLPLYKLASIGASAPLPLKHVYDELQQANVVLKTDSKRRCQLRSELLRLELDAHVHQSDILCRANDQHSWRLLEMRCSINRRIAELEQIWAAKKPKGADEQAAKPKFRSFLLQMVTKDLAESSASLVGLLPPVNGLETLSFRGAPAGAPKKKAPPKKAADPKA